MIEELRQIDTSTVEALQALKQNRSRLEELVAKAEERRSAVSPEIYTRVTGDYGKRLTEVETEARPLRQKARAELARLMTLHASLEAALAQARLDQEELEFRHTLGELDEKPYAERREDVARAVERCAADFQDADRLKNLFAEVLPAGEEPAMPAPAPPPPAPIPAAAPPPAPVPAAPPPPAPVPAAAPPPAPAKAPAPPKPAPPRVVPPPPPPVSDTASITPVTGPDPSEATIADAPSPVADVPPPPAPPPPAPPPPVAAAAAAARRSVPLPPPPPPSKATRTPSATEATVVLSATEVPAAPDAAEGTQLVRWARLVLIRADGSEQLYAIGPTATIGRTKQNDIVIEEADVSRQHARLVLEAGSYVIRDLGSNNGTWVNEERVETSRTLVHGDRVAIGNQNFRFEHQ